ncbi:speckle targeted PIP5K1A-regulated poly(A) polymerase-like [Polistes fuscatus]|uniref:speckle targeted PIP5K1A-regulated poly(A) polymerase-like n=1 Tax=Polistes fuscatus TaxID=30207 RepID=UPI001CA843DF|nr:speckle targeted PIP5K1A-regulated poly(A) polymerase-like [Polistes fuscatus]XP_043502843.1 speckle targeted PIP5K1A-regulated poly(A) polymerase-like [Polistes fuscatus]XP_043502844.1 speckle targeted PIP5K1A-regulated poly(A) polymerase-like [Polistes fuscatus]
MENYCEVCSLQLRDNHEFQIHLSGQKHLKKYQFKEFQRRITENSIFVSSIPKMIPKNTIVKYFQQYGQIAKHKIGQNYVIIEFENREPAEYLLKNPVWLHNTKLNIQKRIFYNNESKRVPENHLAETTKAIDLDCIKSIFNNETTFESQLETFLNTVLLSDAEVEARYESICKFLDKTFAFVFPNCRSYRFGSTQMGLGFKECDLDIYMNIGVPICESNGAFTMKKVFKEVKHVMYKMNNIFMNIVPILKAKTPIIKCYYVPNKVSCDISFKNAFGIYKSNLIKHCLSLDTRIKPLMVLIKFWGRQSEMSGSGKISNYGLLLLIIFYLQQPEIGILPPLMEFQKTCEPIIIDGWQVNFDENTVLPPITNYSTIPQLLTGFFEFYANFPFKRNIICPWDGIAHTKELFTKTSNLPDYMTRYKVIAMQEEFKLSVGNFACIQDPIELNHNNIASAYSKQIILFQKNCKISAEICTSSQEDNYKNLLENLLTYDYKEDVDNFMVVILILSESSLDVGLPDNFQVREDIVHKEIYKKDNWYFIVFNIVKDIFEKVCKLQVTVLSADNETKQQKIEVLSDVHTRKPQKLLLHCTGNDSALLNRRSCTGSSDLCRSPLNKEISISDVAVEKNSKRQEYKPLKLDFICIFEKIDNPVQVQLVLKSDKMKNKFFKNCGNFIGSKLRKITMKTLAHMKRYKLTLNDI